MASVFLPATGDVAQTNQKTMGFPGPFALERFCYSPKKWEPGIFLAGGPSHEEEAAVLGVRRVHRMKDRMGDKRSPMEGAVPVRANPQDDQKEVPLAVTELITTT